MVHFFLSVLDAQIKNLTAKLVLSFENGSASPEQHTYINTKSNKKYV